MQTTLLHKPIEAIEAEALVVFLLEGQKGDPWKQAFGDLFDSGEVTGKRFEMTLLHHPPGFQARRVLLAGAGKPEKFNSVELRKAAGAALRHLKSRSIRDMVFWLGADASKPEYVAAAMEGALLGDYETDRYKSDKTDLKVVDRCAIAVVSGNPALEEALERGRVLADSQNLTRELVNEPANRLTPTLLAERARQVAVESGLDCEVLDRGRMQQLGMGSLLGVAQGSAEPPALIVLRYKPAAAAEATHLGLVGKGVTFDTGGISIKAADGMEKMKYDMAGGAAMLGAMRALGRLKPSIPVTALIPAVENMPGSRAQRPGDIVTSLSGKTIEVINTDAEGRLILADALTYAKQIGCTHLVDAATLTGSVVVALGHINAGVFSNNDELVSRILQSAKAEGEKMWQLPLEEDYKEQYLKSVFADLPNVGPRWGGSITAAMFLKEFADPAPWVHLDIAGTAWLDDAKPYMSKGPSGMGVRTLVHLAMNWNE